MKIGDYVQIKEARGGSGWAWSNRHGHITAVDEHCYSVRADDGEDIRDVREHFRLAPPQ